jgi:uncharacterized protein YjiS (DUF1127 family)
MKLVIQSCSRRLLPDWLRAAFGQMDKGLQWLVTKRRIGQGINELMSCGDRMLSDIGLSRSDIDYSVRHGRARVSASGEASDAAGV